MKINFFVAFFSAILWSGVHAAEPHDEAAGSVNEEGEFSHAAFDQEILAGGNEYRKQIAELSPEDAAKEIRNLVGKIDLSGDGKVDKSELIAWLEKIENHTYQLEADQLFKKEDIDNDGVLTFEEYWTSSEGDGLPPDGVLDDTQLSMKLRFQKADINGDNQLDMAEFAPFIHPFRHDHMVDHLVEDQLVLYDHDQDGTISLEEYIRSFNPDNLQENDTPEWVEEERQEFNERLDRDHNGLLDHKEVRDWMAPNEKEFHEEEANHLFNNVDKDKDGFLTVEEVEAEFDYFVDSPVTDYGHVTHEEL